MSRASNPASEEEIRLFLLKLGESWFKFIDKHMEKPGGWRKLTHNPKLTDECYLELGKKYLNLIMTGKITPFSFRLLLQFRSHYDPPHLVISPRELILLALLQP